MKQTSDLKLENWKNLPVLVVKNESAEARIALHGAHVLSFCPAGGREVLWLSKESWGEPGKPIRGGIPVCWPWFGPAKEPAHGVARLNEWVLKDSVSDQGCTKIKFEAFAYDNLIADMTITVGKELVLELTTTNLGPDDYSLSEALHSYFAVSDIKAVEVHGLDGAEFMNRLTSSRQIQDGAVRFGMETDRIYDHSSAECVIADSAFAQKIHIVKEGSMSTVIWNPWIEKAKRMPDFGDEEFRGMVCVETANAGNDVRLLKAGERHTLKTKIFLA